MSQSIDLSKYKNELISFKAGETIFQKDDSGTEMFLVTQGEIETVINEKVVEVVTPGGVIGEMALLDMGPRSATAVARTDCLLLPINRERFEQQVQKSPNFSLQVMRIMAERLRRLDKFI